MTSFAGLRKALLKFFAKPASHLSALLSVAAILIATAFVAVRTEYAAISSRNLIIHTYGVRDQVAALQIARAEVRATAYAYILRNDPARHKRLLEHIAAANLASANVLNLVQDNPSQVERARKIQTLIDQQSSQLKTCVESPGCKAADFAEDELKEVQVREGQIRTLAIAMDEDEARLVRERLKTWNMLFWRNFIAICIALLIALLLVVYSFRQLNAEVAARKELERVAQQNTESFRALSARILELQDIERRKIARELHDSVGQYLAGLKMNLSQLSSSKYRSSHKRGLVAGHDRHDGSRHRRDPHDLSFAPSAPFG